MFPKMLLCFCVVLACKTLDPTTSDSEPQPGYQILFQDSHSNIPEAVNKEIRSQEQLQDLMAQINSTRKPGLPMPVVDFTQQQVGFVNLGQKSTGGYSVTVDRIERATTETKVFLKTTEPGMMATSVITTPFVLFAMDSSDKAMSFEFTKQ